LAFKPWGAVSALQRRPVHSCQPQPLAPQARAVLFDPPANREEALRGCALAPEDLALARRHRRSHNRVGLRQPLR